MTTDNSVAAEPHWPTLNPHERRVLGVLVEKAKTTPDSYPLTLNALITGCNQKSNRDPILNLGDAEVEEAVNRLKKLGLMQQISGSGRADKYRHILYDTLKVSKVELAVLAELLLRGPQTEGELRGRASRMEPIDDLDSLRAVLRGLAQRNLVAYLTPEGRRGTMVTHGFHAPGELERLRSRLEHEPPEEQAPPMAAVAAPVVDSRMERLEGRVKELEAELEVVRKEMQALKVQLAPLLGG
jgi:uncharacterized protein YceH (UPF0502 family)